jgi:GcrA cell cycle regulator
MHGEMRSDSWTVERLELLRKLWGEGATAAAIGARLGGLSRSAVLGKVFRLRLRTAETPGGASLRARPETVNTPARRRRSQPRIKPTPPSPATLPQHKSLFELTNVTCRWIVEATVKFAISWAWSHLQ